MLTIINLLKNPKKHYLFLLIALLVYACSPLSAQLQASFNSDKAGGCSPLTISFNNITKGASENAVYNWDLGNGNTSTLSNPGAIYEEEKTYIVTLTVTDRGQTSVSTRSIVVYKKPTANFGPEAPKVCLPAPAVFISTSDPGDGYISNYYWDFGNGVTQQGGSSRMTYSFNVVQEASVNLTVTNSYGCVATVTKNKVVEILPQMLPGFKIDKTLLCEITDAISLDASASTGPGTLQYEWQLGDGNSANTPITTHVYNKKGLFTPILTIKNEHGCRATTSVSQVNVAYFNTDFNNSMLCREVNFSSSNYNGVTVTASKWDFGDATNSATRFNVKKTYSTEGQYTVKLENTYNNICKEEITKQIDVKDNVNYNTVINGSDAMCHQSPVSLSVSSSVTPSSRQWDFGDGSFDNYSTAPYYVYRQPGTYTVKLTNHFGTCKEEVSKTIVVHALPNIKPFDANIGGLCGAPVTVSYVDNTSDAVQWTWRINHNYSNGNLVYTSSGIKNPVHNYTNDGTYYIDLTVKNAAGCSASTGQYVTITRPSVGISTIQTQYPEGINNCGNVKSKFKYNSTEPLTDFTWNFGDGNTSKDLEPEFTFTKVGSSPISMSYTTINGCKGTASTNSAIVYRKPTAAFNYSVPACSDRVNIDLNATSNPATHFVWNFGNGIQHGITNTRFTYNDTGRYMVELTAFNGGCSDAISKEVYANVLPKSIRITSISKQSCVNQRGDISFDQSSFRANGLSWNFGDGTSIPYDTSNHLVKHSYTKTGRYIVNLTANSDGCALQQSGEVVILMKQKPVLTASAASICSNQSVNMSITGLETNPYTANHSYDQEYYQYSVYKYEYEDGTPFTGSVSNSFSYNNYNRTMNGLKVGDVKIRAIIAITYLGCYDTTNYVSIKVNGPQAGFKITTNNVCWKSPVVFEDASTAPTNTPITSWRWTYGDGFFDQKTTGASITHLYNNPGSYNVTLTVTDAQGCSSSTSSPANSAIVRGPKVAFTPTGLYVPNVPLNTTITFNNNTNAANSPGVTYLWEYGNDVTSIAYTGSQTYPIAGDYTIKLTATDPVSGCTDNASSSITVRDFNTAFKFSTTYLGSATCPPVQVRITNLSVNATSYSWDFGDGFRIEGVTSPSHTYTTPGKKVITLYSKGYNNLSGIYKDSIYIEESSASMKADILIGCTGQQVNLSADALNTSTYVWDFGDGTVKQTTANAFYKHTYLSAGVFTPKLIVKDQKGCGSTSGIANKIIIDSLNVSLSGLSKDLCQFNDNVFTPAIYSLAESYAGEKLTYKWDYGTGNGSDGSADKQGAFVYNQYGEYAIKLTVSSPYGCIKEDIMVVDVHEKDGLKLTAPDQLDVCKNSSITINVTGAHSYEWIDDVDGLNNTQIRNPITTPISDITYTVMGYDKWKCSSDMAKVKVIVRPLPTVNAGNDLEVVANTEEQLMPVGSSDIIKWEWTPANYLHCVNCPSPIIKPKRSGAYIVKVHTVYNCEAQDTIYIKLKCLNGYIYIPNTFTPNRDGKNDLFYIKGKGIGIIKSFRIFDRWGHIVFQRTNFEIDDKSLGWDGTKNGHPVPVGTYVYVAEMSCEDGGEPLVKRGTVTVVY